MSSEKAACSLLSVRTAQVVVMAACIILGSISGAAEPKRVPPDIIQVQALWDVACQAEGNGSAECVDLFYRCAVTAYACLAANPHDEAAATSM